MEVAYLVSGYDDLSEAAQEAQALGVQVVALVVPGRDGAPLSSSGHLHQTVDRLMLINADDLDARTDVFDIPEATRFALRRTFWERVDRLG